MTIEYKSANRITGNSTDNLVTPTFEDFFTSYTSQTDFDNNWVTEDTTNIRGNPTTNIIKWIVPSGATENDMMYYDLGSNLSDTAWVSRWAIRLDNLVQGADSTSQRCYFGVFDDNTSSRENAQDGIHFDFRVNSTFTAIHAGSLDEQTTITTAGGDRFFNDLVADRTYYIELSRLTATTFRCSIYLDQGYSELLSTVEGSCASTTQGLRYVKLMLESADGTSNHTLDGTLLNVQFWDGVENNTVADFTDDFTGTDDWTDVNTGVEVNVTTDVIDWVADGNLNRMTYNNRTSISDDFILRWEFTTDTATNGSDTTGSKLWVTVSNNTNGSNGLQDFCGIGFFISNTQQQIVLRTGNNVNPKDGGGGIFTTTGAVGTRYYELRRAGNQLTGSIYSDSGYSNLIEKQTITSDPATITGLQYVKIFSGEETDGTEDHTYDGTINIVSLWDGLVSLQSPADNDSKPYEVPTWSTFDELDTAERKTYMGNKNYVPLNTRFDSYYQHRSPFSILQKQHFREFFSGKQISSIWSFTDHQGTNSGAMDDSIDGGFTITTGTTTNDVRSYHFNDKRQYDSTGCRIICTTKLGTASNVIGVVGSDNLFNDDYFYMGVWSSAGNTNHRLLTHNGTSGSSTDSGIASNTNWRLNVGDMNPSNNLYFIDGNLGVTKTTNLPALKHQPRLRCDTETGSARTLSIRYYEVYNT